MCLQCSAKAKTIIKDIIPGYDLMKSTKDCDEWPKGYYGLICNNDPDFIWKDKPILDPTFDITELEKFEDDNIIWKKCDEFFEVVESIEPHFECDPLSGYNLIKACKKAGWDEEKHGFRILCWLTHHMATEMKKVKNV